MRGLLLAALLGIGCGGFTYADKQCPTCTIVEAAQVRPISPKPGARTLFVLVPGMLGFGWEWDKPIARLRTRSDLDFVVFWWTPFASLYKAGGEMRTVLERLLALPTIDDLVLVGHSVGGMVAVEGLRDLVLPAGKRLHVATIGTPFGGLGLDRYQEESIVTRPWVARRIASAPGPTDRAGPVGPATERREDESRDSPARRGRSRSTPPDSGLTPAAGRNPRRTPLLFGIVSSFDSYPSLPEGTTLTTYVTRFPADPVMEPHYGHRPADPATDPPGTQRIPVDAKADHNQIVDFVVEDLLRRVRECPQVRP